MRNNLRHNLKRYRILRDLTKNDLALKLGISYSSYCNYEYGNREPNLELVIEIARLFDVTLDELIL